MVFFNWATMQMAAKIVYYGPGLCGKTTNLSYIYAKTAPGSRGEMVSLETETDRTLFFDLLPLEVGKVGGFRTRLQLYTVPGQVFYNTTRKLVLKGVDGVVFVADSQRPMADANVESFRNLEENLRELGLTIDSIPLVVQLNKRDLKSVLSVEELQALLNPEGRWECFEAVAVQGHGVFETLKAITKTTLKALRRRMATQDSAPAPAPAAPARPPAPVEAPRASFSAAALSAAAADGLGSQTATAVAEPDVEEPPTAEPELEVAPPAAAEEPTPEPEAEALEAADGVELPPPVVVDEAADLPAAEEIDLPTPIEVESGVAEAEEAEEVLEPPEEIEVPQAAETVGEVEEPAEVEFATGPEPAPRAEPEVRHVKVSSSLDILAELENLRKAATSKPSAHEPSVPAARPYDLDSLLQSSLNSRQDVRRRIDENVGTALRQASKCLVRIELVDPSGDVVSAMSPVEVDIKRGERIKQLAMTLTVHIKGD